MKGIRFCVLFHCLSQNTDWLWSQQLRWRFQRSASAHPPTKQNLSLWQHKQSLAVIHHCCSSCCCFCCFCFSLCVCVFWWTSSLHSGWIISSLDHLTSFGHFFAQCSHLSSTTSKSASRDSVSVSPPPGDCQCHCQWQEPIEDWVNVWRLIWLRKFNLIYRNGIRITSLTGTEL